MYGIHRILPLLNSCRAVYFNDNCVRHISTLLEEPKELFKRIEFAKLGRVHRLSIVFNIWAKNGGWARYELNLFFEQSLSSLLISSMRRIASYRMRLSAGSIGHFAQVFSSTPGPLYRNQLRFMRLACEVRILGFHFLAG